MTLCSKHYEVVSYRDVKISILKYGIYIDIFCCKNVSSFCKSYSHFCSKNNNVFENTLATTVNEFVISKLIKLMMLWTTGPRFLSSRLGNACVKKVLIYIFFYFSLKTYDVLLVRTASMRCFRWVPTTRFYGEIRRIFFRLPLFSEAMGVYYFHKTSLITKICLFKYTENFTTKKWNFSDKKFWFFFIFLLKT